MRYDSIYHQIRAKVEKRHLWDFWGTRIFVDKQPTLVNKTTTSQTNFGLGPRSLGHFFHDEKAVQKVKKANVSHCICILDISEFKAFGESQVLLLPNIFESRTKIIEA